MHVGVDVAKQYLDWAEGPEAPVQRVSNDTAGIRMLLRLQRLAPERVILEPTGGYERPLLYAVVEAGLAAVVVKRVGNDGRGRIGQGSEPSEHAGIDRIGLANRAETLSKAPHTPPAQRATADLVARRRQLIGIIVSEKQRLQRAPGRLRREIAGLVAILERRVARLDKQLHALLSQDAPHS